MLADLVLPLIALAVALIPIAPASPSPEATMLDDTEDADAATLGGPIPTADPVAVPDSPPPPGATNPDTGTDDGTGPTAVPTPPPTDPAPPAGPKQVTPRDVLAATATDRGANVDLKARMAELSTRLAESNARVEADDRRISTLTRKYPDGILTTGPDGKPAVYAFSTAAPGYYITHPVADDTPMDDPGEATQS